MAFTYTWHPKTIYIHEGTLYVEYLEVVHATVSLLVLVFIFNYSRMHVRNIVQMRIDQIEKLIRVSELIKIWCIIS
jgi:hypothetical protein